MLFSKGNFWRANFNKIQKLKAVWRTGFGALCVFCMPLIAQNPDLPIYSSPKQVNSPASKTASSSAHLMPAKLHPPQKPSLKRSNIFRRSQRRPLQGNSVALQPEAVVDTAQILWAKQFGMGAAASTEHFVDLATDGVGNILVTGWSSAQPFGTEYLTQKYDSGGNLVWEARFGGDGNGDNKAKAIAVDGSGNAAVSGVAFNSETYGYDITTVYYNSGGVQQWSVAIPVALRHSSLMDEPTAVKFDSNGNVCVCGWVLALDQTGTFIRSDWVVIKYDAAGNEMWSDYYDSGIFEDDWAVDMIPDAFGNLYVTGISETNNYEDMLTIKYDVSGARAWTKIFDQGWYEEATAIARDADGNIIVSGTDGDFLTLKYDENGIQLWFRRMDGPLNGDDYVNDVAVDTSGNVIVAGETEGNFGDYDFLTVKYSGAGDTLWAVTYDGNGTGSAGGYSLDVDTPGNIYVTGYEDTTGQNDFTISTIKYDTSGALQWSKRQANYSDYSFDRSVAVLSNGQILTAGTVWGNDYDLRLQTYQPDGSAGWQYSYDGVSNSWETARFLFQDDMGNIYIGGTSWDGDYDVFAAKFDPNGMLLWSNRSDGGYGSTDTPLAMAVDDNGNIYFAGYTYNGSYQDFLTVKYNANGNESWIRTFSGAANRNDNARDIAIDASGDIIVTGESDIDNQNNSELVTIKYDSAGGTVWQANHRILKDARPLCLAINSASEVYVGGAAVHPSGSTNSMIVKYNTNGDTLWSLVHDGFGNNMGYYGQDMILDAAENVVMVGHNYLSKTQLAKVSPVGDTLWVKEMSGHKASVLMMDNLGNLFVAGDATTNRFFTAKYDLNGNESWSATYPANGNQSYSAGLDLDNGGNAYVTGESYGISFYDFGVVKYSSNGMEEWSARYDLAARSNSPAGVAVDANNDITVVGTTDSDDWSVVTIVKYQQVPVGIKDSGSPQVPENSYLAQNYPNPFNPVTKIRYAISGAVNGAGRQLVSLKVYDILGREVATLVDEEKPVGEYAVEFNGSSLSSGIYFYQLKAGSCTQTKKLILMK